jgi:hypothetical protein
MTRSSATAALCLLNVALVACGQDVQPAPDLAMRVTRLCQGSAAEQFFGNQIADRDDAEKLAAQLKGLGEPPLACDSHDRDAYRLFARAPGGVWTMLRLEMSGPREAVSLTFYRANKPRVRRRLTADETVMIQRALENMNVWSRPQVPPNFSSPGLDRSAWFLESRSGNRYRLVHSNWSAEPPDVRRAWRRLFESGGDRAPGEFSSSLRSGAGQPDKLLAVRARVRKAQVLHERHKPALRSRLARRTDRR